MPSPPVLAVIVLVFIPMAGLFSSRPDHYLIDVTEATESIESGDLGNRIAFPLLCALGLYFILKRPVEVVRLSITPWVVLYLVLLCLSVLWSWEPWLTLRRVAVPVGVVAFAFGIGAVYYGTKPDGYVALARTIVWTSSIASLGVVAACVLQGDLEVTAPSGVWEERELKTSRPGCSGLGF